MAKWSGIVGFRIPTEIEPGDTRDVIFERRYKGDSITDGMKINSSNQQTRDFTIKKRISLVADPYAVHNYLFISHISYMGVLWEVSSVDIQYPRLILDIGGVYNGERPESIETNSPSVT